VYVYPVNKQWIIASKISTIFEKIRKAKKHKPRALLPAASPRNVCSTTSGFSYKLQRSATIQIFLEQWMLVLSLINVNSKIESNQVQIVPPLRGSKSLLAILFYRRKQG
jgi:hypothetical protein